MAMTQAARPARRAGTGFVWRASLLLSPLCALLIAAGAHAAAPAPRGLIVELTDAPQHAEPATRDVTTLSVRADPEALQRERLQRVVAAAGLANAAAAHGA